MKAKIKRKESLAIKGLTRKEVEWLKNMCQNKLVEQEGLKQEKIRKEFFHVCNNLLKVL